MQIRLNLVIALAAAQLAFLSGIDALEPKVGLLYCLNFLTFSPCLLLFLLFFSFVVVVVALFKKKSLITPLENHKKRQPSNELIRVQKVLVQLALHEGRSESRSQSEAKIVRQFID